MNKTMKFFVVSILAVVVIFVCFTLAIAGNDVLLCHKPEHAAEHWLWVDHNAVQAHLGHGDFLWSKDATICGGKEITPPPVPIVTCAVGNPCDPPPVDPPDDPEPIVTQEPVIYNLLYLPMVKHECRFWPWCSIPKLNLLDSPYPPPD